MELIFTLSDILSSRMVFIAISLSLFFIFIALLRNITAGLALLIFSIPLSPEITGIFGPEIPIRMDDILIIMLFWAWIMKIGSGETEIYRTPFTLPIVAIFTLMVISTIIGYGYKQTITNPRYSLLVLVKNFEYYAIFFLAANIIHTRKQIRNTFRLWMVAYFVVIMYGIIEQILKSPGRLYDFGWYHCQSNHMGGYLIISTMLAIAFLFSVKDRKAKSVYRMLIILYFFPFLYNGSKESYLSFSASLFLMFLILKPRFLLVPIAIILVLFIMLPYLFPHTIPGQAIRTTKEDTFRLDVDIQNPSSADIRRKIIVRAFQELPDNPIIGCGAGHKPLPWYDSQIPLLIFEGGIIGIGLFLWLLFRIIINGFRIFLTSKDLYFKAISAAFLASVFGILIQSIPSTAWVITLIMEPFWFFAGIMVAIDRINKREMACNKNS